MPVPYLQALNQSLSQDVQRSSQAMDLNGLEGVMDILVAISSCLKTTQRGMEELRAERTATQTQSPSTSGQEGRADCGREQTQAQLQPSPQEADLSEAVQEKVA